jgi:hypothetical protein
MLGNISLSFVPVLIVPKICFLQSFVMQMLTATSITFSQSPLSALSCISHQGKAWQKVVRRYSISRKAVPAVHLQVPYQSRIFVGYDLSAVEKLLTAQRGAIRGTKTRKWRSLKPPIRPPVALQFSAVTSPRRSYLHFVILPVFFPSHCSQSLNTLNCFSARSLTLILNLGPFNRSCTVRTTIETRSKWRKGTGTQISCSTLNAQASRLTILF